MSLGAAVRFDNIISSGADFGIRIREGVADRKYGDRHLRRKCRRGNRNLRERLRRTAVANRREWHQEQRGKWSLHRREHGPTPANTAEYNELTGIYLGKETEWSGLGNSSSHNGSYGYQCDPTSKHWSGSAQAIKGRQRSRHPEWVSSEQLHLFMVLGARRRGTNLHDQVTASCNQGCSFAISETRKAEAFRMRPSSKPSN